MLVVDDVEDNRELHAFIFRRGGFVVETAASGDEAVDLAGKLKPAVIVMDLAMPVVDGFEAARRIRALPDFEAVKIVAVSAFTDEKTRRRALEAGYDHYLTKPCDPAALLEYARRATASRT